MLRLYSYHRSIFQSTGFHFPSTLRAIFLTFFLILSGSPAFADESKSEVMQLDDIIVKAKGQSWKMIMTPLGTIIDPDKYETIGPSTSVLVLLDTQAIIDFRGISDLTPDEDTITMRGFSSNRFVTAIDGLTVQKTGCPLNICSMWATSSPTAP